MKLNFDLNFILITQRWLMHRLVTIHMQTGVTVYGIYMQ